MQWERPTPVPPALPSEHQPDTAPSMPVETSPPPSMLDGDSTYDNDDDTVELAELAVPEMPSLSIRTSLDMDIPIPETPPPPTPVNVPCPEIDSLIDQIRSGNSPAEAGLNLAQMLNNLQSSESKTSSAPDMEPYVRAMSQGRGHFEALQNTAADMTNREADHAPRFGANVQFDWSDLSELTFETHGSPRARAPTLPPLPPNDDHDVEDEDNATVRKPTLPGMSPIVFRQHLQQVFEIISEDVSKAGEHLTQNKGL